MSSDTKSTTSKQKILLTLIAITIGLLIVSLVTNIGGAVTAEDSMNREACLQQGGVWDNSTQECYSNAAVLTFSHRP